MGLKEIYYLSNSFYNSGIKIDNSLSEKSNKSGNFKNMDKFENNHLKIKKVHKLKIENITHLKFQYNSKMSFIKNKLQILEKPNCTTSTNITYANCNTTISENSVKTISPKKDKENPIGINFEKSKNILKEIDFNNYKKISPIKLNNKDSDKNKKFSKENNLIISKIFDTTHYKLKNEKKELNNKEKIYKFYNLPNRELNVKIQVNEIKSKLHFVKEIYDVIFPKVMVDKIKRLQTSQKLNENNSVTPNRRKFLFTNSTFTKLRKIKFDNSN